MSEVKESDWRIFRELRAVALERFCQRVVAEVERLSADSAKTFHRRYVDIYRYTRERERELSVAFDDPRRSTAMLQLACIQRHDLLTAEELSRFSEETRNKVEALLAVRSR